MNTDNKHSDLKNTISVMHNGQGYSMIEVRGLADVINNQWRTFHYLFVRLDSFQMLEYSFILGPDGSDELYGVKVVNKTFDEVLVEQSRRIILDGDATLVVYPW